MNSLEFQVLFNSMIATRDEDTYVVDVTISEIGLAEQVMFLIYIFEPHGYSLVVAREQRGRRHGWKRLVGIPIDRGRFDKNSRTSFLKMEGIDVEHIQRSFMRGSHG